MFAVFIRLLRTELIVHIARYPSVCWRPASTIATLRTMHRTWSLPWYPSAISRSYQVASRYRMGWRVRHRRSATSAHKWKDRDLPQARSETLLGGGPLPDQPSTTRQSSRPFGRRCNLPRPTFRSTFAMRVPRALWTRSRLAMILSSYCAEHGCKLTSDHGCRIDILPPSDAAPGVASASSRNWPSSLSGPLGVRTVKCRSVSSQ